MAQQVLPQRAYVEADWFARERRSLLFSEFHFAGFADALKVPGDFITATICGYPMFVILDQDETLRAFHNLCRHRGTELLEGDGNCGKTIVCPYHRWTYMLDGRLRGLPNRDLFEELNRAELGLKPASVGRWKGMVFVSPDPQSNFAEWISPLRDVAFPHDIETQDLVRGQEFVYRIKCNWKVFFENAIDGYHLAYLHEHTLGGPEPALNEWVNLGKHMVWYSTERDGIRNRIPKFVEDQTAKSSIATIPGADVPGYGGVYMLYPTTIITPSPWSLTISAMEPVDATTTIMRATTFVANSWFRYSESPSDAEGYDKSTGLIESKNWKKHPLETGDFQTEDIWVCEKMQRSLASPFYQVGPLAEGAGAETPLTSFQNCVLEDIADL
ncbi:MAG: aromatic ring-hydroxylating dioxygenase subunit alpha [Pseudomonadota bacterium]